MLMCENVSYAVISKERQRLRNLHKRVSQIPTPAAQAQDDNEAADYYGLKPS